MRTLKECYQVLLDFITKEDVKTRGICLSIDYCHDSDLLDLDEWEILHKHFNTIKPKWYHLEFYNPYYNSFNRSFGKFYSAYWWSRDLQGFNRRKIFLQKQIDKL